MPFKRKAGKLTADPPKCPKKCPSSSFDPGAAAPPPSPPPFLQVTTHRPTSATLPPLLLPPSPPLLPMVTLKAKFTMSISCCQCSAFISAAMCASNTAVCASCCCCRCCSRCIYCSSPDTGRESARCPETGSNSSFIIRGAPLQVMLH